MALDYFYHQQLRSLLLQFTRVFAGYQFQTGKQRDGTPLYRQVPVRIANRDRMAQHIRSNNSENITNTIPIITTYIDDLEMAPDWRVDPYFSDKHAIAEREINDQVNPEVYTGKLGGRYDLERYMPVPLKVTFNTDIWTSNMEQKFQLFEQIYTIFNPSIDLQDTTNQFDWGAIKVLELMNMVWTSAQVPVGTSVDYENIDITTFTFMTHTWISPPGKMTKLARIEQIVTNVGLAVQGVENCGQTFIDSSDLLTRSIVTPGNYKIRVVGNEITLLGANGSEIDSHGEKYSWKDLIELYGTFRPTISQLRLKTNTNLDDTDSDISGIIEYHATEENILVWSPDPNTLPTNSISPVNAIINPQQVYPGGTLPTATAGQRYLLLDEIGNNTSNWGTLASIPSANDIIEYDGSTWIVSFDSSAIATNHYVLNNATGKQLKWSKVEEQGPWTWTFAVDAEYFQGFWRLAL